VPDYAPVDLAADEMVEFELDGRKVSVPPGTLLVDACAAHRTEVPIFCYEPRLGAPLGACRMCLVRVEGMRGLQTACSTPVQADMVVDTQSTEVTEAQDGILELLLENHPLDCPVCDKGGECPLQDRTFRFGPGKSRMIEPKRHFPKPLELSPQIALDRERCISCYRCVRFSQDVAEDGCLTMQERGNASEITTFSGDAYEGRFTGNVIDICPVGALTSIPYRFVSRPWDVTNTPSVCAGCSVGCNTELTVREGEIKRVTGRDDPNWAVEDGWLCNAGRWAYGADRAAERVRTPLLRDAAGTREASLEDAVAAAGLLLAQSSRHSLVLSGDATIEEAFIAQQIAAGPLDGARVGAEAVDGAALAPLRALPTAQLGDVDGCDLVVIVGGNVAQQHPVVELRVRKAHRAGATISLVGPRSQELDSLAQNLRTAPARLVDGIEEVAKAIAAARSPVIFWDELDLASEPDAAVALASIVSEHGSARQIELAAEVNGAGLRALGVQPMSNLVDEELGCIVTLRSDPLCGPGAQAWESTLADAGPIIAIATHHSAITERANVVIPSLTHLEHDGVLVTAGHRAQRIRPGASGPGDAAPGWEVLVALMHRLGVAPGYRSARDAFAAAAATNTALMGLDYEALGHEGRPIPHDAAGDANSAGQPRAFLGTGTPLVVQRAVFANRDVHLSEGLASAAQAEEIVLNPHEAERLGVETSRRVKIESDFGSCIATLRLDPSVAEGAVFASSGRQGEVERIFGADRAPINVKVSAAV